MFLPHPFAHPQKGWEQISLYRYNKVMSVHRHMTSRIIRPGQSEPADTSWTKMSTEERIDAVWQLTLLCWYWNRDDTKEPRLQRTISRVQHSGR